MGDYPYPTNFLAPLPGHPVNVACKIMASASYKLQGLADVTGMVYNGTNGTLTCLDPDTEYIECADPTGCGLGPDSRALDYQVCSELVLHVAGSNNKTDMFSTSAVDSWHDSKVLPGKNGVLLMTRLDNYSALGKRLLLLC
ncbi:Dipeptidyl peptidase 2 [Desmophyllum pertusum]|uniref:Dipeptidyl peptidase 2 n=1 Tax=Desmophyllum pertusum TaxID=174260 RepID=A0A9W9ZBG4_9CNID|nr:Dipeptidyl peptidase 2 [Desmophyllum pertusum]